MDGTVTTIVVKLSRAEDPAEAAGAVVGVWRSSIIFSKRANLCHSIWALISLDQCVGLLFLLKLKLRCSSSSKEHLVQISNCAQ